MICKRLTSKLFFNPFASSECFEHESRRTNSETSRFGLWPHSKRTGFVALIISLILNLITFNAARSEDNHLVLQDKLNQAEMPYKKRPSRHKNLEKKISFYFDNESLIDIINLLASYKEINIILPIGANAINATVTLHLEDKITIDEAWDILYTLLDIAGYSMIAKEETYNIVKTTKDVSREPLPLFIVKPEELPNIDKRIRYLYYFANVKLVGDERDPQDEVVKLLRDILPAEGSPGMLPTTSYKLDPQTNSLLISDKANNIKAFMKIIEALDQNEVPEKPEIIQLRYLNADVVANLFNEQLLRTAGDLNQQRLGIRPPNNGTYFKKVKIVPDARTNRLIVFGRPQAIERVRDFIHKYIDVELESGKSILHVYQLQYLDAKKFAGTLSKIVKSERSGGTEQSKAGTTTGGTERFFDQVLIFADQVETVSGEQPGGASQGNNNLIIAARNDDYERIKKLIEELDVPQPQVIIEVLIADLSVDELVALGTSVRNPLWMGLPNGVNFQSAQATDFLTNTVANPTTIQADLLRRAYLSTGAISDTCDTQTTGNGCFSGASFIAQPPAQGTTVLSFNDAATGQTWGIAQVLQSLDVTKIISHPHLITTNNQKATIVVNEERFAIDQASGSSGGTTTQTRKWIPASLSVELIPRISSANVVNLNIIVNINQFDSNASTFTNEGPNAASSANQTTRNVITNANVSSGHVLALGGLTRVDTAIEQLEVPFLAKIPIIGWLFKDRSNAINKNNLTVFISPTIIMPRLRAGVGAYTKNHMQLTKSYTREGMIFDNLRDPITRWFFKTQKDDAERSLDDFIAQDEFIAPTIYDVRKEVVRITDAKPHQETAPLTTASGTEHKDATVAIADLKTLLADIENPFEKKT